jgi:DNA phosphorothioation-dependent restriction protein DptG
MHITTGVITGIYILLSSVIFLLDISFTLRLMIYLLYNLSLITLIYKFIYQLKNL